MRWPWQRKEEPTTAGSWGMPPSDPGRWRFSRFDGRFVYDYADSRKGFTSPTFCDPDAFAAYVNGAEEKS